MSILKNIATFSIVFTFVLSNSPLVQAEETPQVPGPADSSSPQGETPDTTGPIDTSVPQTDPGAGSVSKPTKPRTLPAPVPKKYPDETETIPNSGIKRLIDPAKPVRTGEVQNVKKEIQVIKDDRREAVGAEQKDIRSDVRNIKDDVKNGSTTREEGRENTKTRLEDGRAAISAEREKARGEIELKREEMRTEVERKRAEHFAKIGEMYVKRYLAAYDRLINIKERIVAHIEKIEAKGQDASAAKIELDKATPILAKALTAIDELKTALTNVANSPEDATLKTVSQEKSEIAKTSLKDAHAALIKVIENLKPKKPSETASSSSTTI